MSIQYKFKSAVDFQTVEIKDRASISIEELRGYIMQRVFKQQQGSDLLFYDAGLEFLGDDSQIPKGSKVIVKRVPGGTVPSAVLHKQALNHVTMKESHNQNPIIGPMDEFDALGANFCPTPDSNFPGFRQEFGQTKFKGNKKDEVAGLRLPTYNILAVQLDLKCSLCYKYLKDAVMMPCCQHSFCDKCIRQVLMRDKMCPACFSRKCSVRHPIPNLSLRVAVSHFLESRMFDTDLEKNVRDRESGNHAPSRVVKRELELCHSSCASGKGSNQLFAEPLYDDADSSIRRGGRFGGWSFQGPDGHKKGVRNWYTCGSPDHLMRDCPMSHSKPMFQPGNGIFNGGMPGYAAPYLYGPSVHPYANLYSNPAMMPSCGFLAPVSPSPVPHCTASMHGSLPGPSVNMTMRNMEPPCPEHFGLQQCRHERKHS